jgi:hypothetical protein
MNSKQMKELRRKADNIQLEWVKSLMSEDEAKQVNVNNFWQFLPRQTHLMADGKLALSVMSYKWVVKMLKKHPEIESYQDMMDIYNNKLNQSINQRR